jgi:hypothetical protein
MLRHVPGGARTCNPIDPKGQEGAQPKSQDLSRYSQIQNVETSFLERLRGFDSNLWLQADLTVRRVTEVVVSVRQFSQPSQGLRP